LVVFLSHQRLLANVLWYLQSSTKGASSPMPGIIALVLTRWHPSSHFILCATILFNTNLLIVYKVKNVKNHARAVVPIRAAVILAAVVAIPRFPIV